MHVNSFSLSVRDVLGKSWPITLEYTVNTLLATGPRTTDVPAGAWSIAINENVNSLDLKVSHEQFPTQTTTIGLATAPIWDNRNFAVQVNGADIDITLTLCRLRQAPCVTVPRPLVETPQSTEAQRFDLRQFQRGIWIDPGDPKSRYMGISRIDPTRDPPSDGYPLTRLRTLNDQNGTVLKSSPIAGWGRFSVSDSTPDLASQGGFLWLEYGAPDAASVKPVFLVGLWLPRLPDNRSNSALDVIINLGHSPTASNWIPQASFPSRDSYPYLSKERNPDKEGFLQTYPYFGRLYLLQSPTFSFFYVHQMIASGKPAVLVMPVVPKTDKADLQFQPFNSRAGLHRLLLELQQFLYQLGYGESSFDFNRLEGRSAIVDGLPRPQMSPTLTASGQLPAFAAISVCAHSSGLGPVLTLLQNSVSGGGRVDIANQSIFPADFYAGMTSNFDNQWKEIWDLDLSFAGFPDGTRDNYLDTAVAWLNGRNDRRLRSYHSAQTGAFSDFSKLTGSNRISWQSPPTRMTGPDAQDWRSQDGRVTFVHLSTEYLSDPSPDTGVSPRFPLPNAPWFIPHQFAMILGFGHASKLRKQGL
jgi:hypothetical protein